MSELKAVPKPKQVRFSQVVAKCGKPESYTLWMPPAKDKTFQVAIKGHRIMTVYRSNVGTKKDYATAGYDKEKEGIFLLFPKSLKSFEGKVVVGIKYDLLDPGPLRPRAQQEPKKKAAPKTSSTSAHFLALMSKEKKKITPPAPPPPAKSPAKPAVRKQPREEESKENKQSEPPTIESLTAHIKRALRYLGSGKQVMAYDVLKKALAANPSS